MPRRFFDDFEAAFGIAPREHWGMTETNTAILNPLVPGDRRIGSVGLPMPEVEIEVRDPAGQALATGREGELWVKSPASMVGYWGEPERTAEVMKDGWVATGDAGRLDEEGFLWFTGRVKHVIICDGDNIHPGEVEREIAKHPRVAQACVVGLPPRSPAGGSARPTLRPARAGIPTRPSPGR